MHPTHRVVVLQVADWGRHKASCKAHRTRKDDIRQLERTFDLFHQEIFYRQAILSALHNAFAIHQTPLLTDHHGWRLDFDFDPLPTKSCEQFILRTATVLSHADMAAVDNIENASDPTIPTITSSYFSTSSINARSPTAAPLPPNILRIPVILFAWDATRNLHAYDNKIYFTKEIPTAQLALVRKRYPLVEVLPPANYDWLGVLRQYWELKT
ncbi:hypothetical protein RQP46_010279 [Phenoliferia psychrophenolica]